MVLGLSPEPLTYTKHNINCEEIRMNVLPFDTAIAIKQHIFQRI